MKVGNSKVIEIHYTIKDKFGDVIDSTEEEKPYAYLHGANNIVEGLEDALDELDVGSSFYVTVPPEKGYGVKDMRLINIVEKEIFPKEAKIAIGEKFITESQSGPLPVIIKEVFEKTVVIDGNHELAGQTLHYSGKVISVREANSNELYHGQVNSPCCVGDKCVSDG
jgi:FKBP-type peptidyl-prolyl cis-trans isomerase SlyD